MDPTGDLGRQLAGVNGPFQDRKNRLVGRRVDVADRVIRLGRRRNEFGLRFWREACRR
jgi:hypothetical protein